MGHQHRWRRDGRGAAAVEFALITPLLLVLLFGIVGYGYMLSFRQALSQAAAEGARAAAVTVPTTGDSGAQVAAARAAVADALQTYGVTCEGTTLRRAGVTVGSCAITVAACANQADRRCATVDLDYRYRDHTLIPSVPGAGVVLPDHLAYSATARVD